MAFGTVICAARLIHCSYVDHLYRVDYPSKYSRLHWAALRPLMDLSGMICTQVGSLGWFSTDFAFDTPFRGTGDLSSFQEASLPGDRPPGVFSSSSDEVGGFFGMNKLMSICWVCWSWHAVWASSCFFEGGPEYSSKLSSLVLAVVRCSWAFFLSSFFSLFLLYWCRGTRSELKTCRNRGQEKLGIFSASTIVKDVQWVWESLEIS